MMGGGGRAGCGVQRGWDWRYAGNDQVTQRAKCEVVDCKSQASHAPKDPQGG